MNNLLQAVNDMNDNKSTFYTSMFPKLDAKTVNTVLQNVEDDSEIMRALNVLSFGDLPEDLLRACAVSTSRNRESPKLERKKVPGDGKCLFHAVCKALEEMEGGNVVYTTDELRTFVFNQMQEPQFAGMTMEMLEFENAGTDQSTEQLFEAYITSMREGRYWAGDLELKIIAQLVNREIQVWVSFEEYAKHTWAKDPADRHVLQVSTDADYVLFSEENCFFPLKPADKADVPLRLLVGYRQ